MFSLKTYLPAIALTLLFSFATGQTNPIVAEDLIFEEIEGYAAVEAEYFYKQSKNQIRQWYLFSKGKWPKPGLDHDEPHCQNASNHAYLEILPDTRVHHGNKLTVGENFSPTPGLMGLLHYKIHFNNPGRYYVWVRAYSTGSEDNGIHVGLNGEWPDSGRQMQWCEGKKTWRWESKQRTSKNHCGEPYKIFLDIEKPGVHEIIFSMREDGFEFDKFLLTTDRNFQPNKTADPVFVKSGKLPKAFPRVDVDLATKKAMIQAIGHDVSGVRMFGALQFSTPANGLKMDRNYLAINHTVGNKGVAVTPFKPFYKPHLNEWDVVLLSVGEKQGQAEYSFSVNGSLVGTYTPPLSREAEEPVSKYCKVWKNVRLKEGDTMEVSVQAKQGSASGRWAGLAIVPPGESSARVLQAVDKNAAIDEPVPLLARPASKEPVIEGEMKRWHKTTITFNGPDSSETAEYNPFMHYKFEVTFTHPESGDSFLVPGYFAADGNAANTSASKGNKWRVHFTPNQTGQWKYEVNFRKGPFAAISERRKTGASGEHMDGFVGVFTIAETDKSGRDFRGKGLLEYVGERYLQFSHTKEYFLKVGADAPENLLAYEEFDGTFHNDGFADQFVKTWEAHEKHWKAGDPTWKDGKGKDIIGAFNYLASKGMNAVSFLTMNIQGDDKNVFPYIDYHTYDRIDCSKMDQWEILFSHADELGLFLHFKLMEVENQGLLDNGGIGAHSKLYYREIIARFGHHLALNWNMCEENGEWVKNQRTPPQYTRERLAMADYVSRNDPYKHHIVIHNGNQFDDLLGPDSPYTGVSVQTHRTNFDHVHWAVSKWIKESKKAGKQWAVACDEPGDASHALLPDSLDPEHNDARMNGLWGCFMAGGWGTEWYFGYKNPHSDLTCQDYASRDLFWDQGKIALDFFSQNNIPFWEMEGHDSLIKRKGDYCFAKPGEIYVFFTKQGQAQVDLSAAKGKMKVRWYDPRKGGKLQKGSRSTVSPAAQVDLGKPPYAIDSDWVVLVTR
ncbi:MAG: DUF5060 domain-containing protein [Coraliomargaritaceae bacterium]